MVHTLRCYLERTMAIRDSETQLLISFCKPHKSVSTDTASCWIKSVMTRLLAGIPKVGVQFQEQ